MSDGEINERVGSPAPRPCESCPYRRDVPSGVWAAEEYQKLSAYDRDTSSQPASLFLCHQHDRGSRHARLCSGWVACHGEELLALRLAALSGSISETTCIEAMQYMSPVPLFDSGTEAAQHGLVEVEQPSAQAVALISKIFRRRDDLTT